MNFHTAFADLVMSEGGYSNHPADRGGETMWGITKEVAARNGYKGDMSALPVEIAEAIYVKDYWNPVQADKLPEDLRYAVFDAAVNSGVAQAARWLQRACGVRDDGIVGPQTIRAANALSSEEIKRKMLAQRLRFMTSLSNWPSFSRGWARRIADLLEK